MPAETEPRRKKTIFIPRMADHAFAMRSAFRASGFDAEVLPESDEETLYWGKSSPRERNAIPSLPPPAISSR